MSNLKGGAHCGGSGAACTTLASGQPGPSFIINDGSFVYWNNTTATGTEPMIARAPVTGGAVTTLASGTWSPTHLALGPDDVYFISTTDTDHRISRVPKAGGQVATVYFEDTAHMTRDQFLTVQGSYVYWITYSASEVNRVPVAGGARLVIGRGANGVHPYQLAVDSTHVYWNEIWGTWAIYRTPR